MKNKIKPIFTGNEKTATAKFLHFLMNVGFLPLTVDEKEANVKFKLWSKSTMFHVLILSVYFGLVFFYFLVALGGNVFGTVNTHLTAVEMISLWASCLSHISIIFPFTIAKGFSSASIPASLILNPNQTFPKHGTRTILATGISVLGGVMFVTGFMIRLNFPTDLFWKMGIIQFCQILYIISFWTLSTFIAETLTQNLMSKKREYQNLRLVISFYLLKLSRLNRIERYILKLFHLP